MTRSRHTPTDRLARRLDRAAGIIPDVLAHLNELRANITTLTTPTNEHTSRSGHSDPTARTTLQLDAINLHQRAIDDQVHCVEVAINLLEEACRDGLGYRAPRAANSEPLCGGGDPSTWGDPTCGDIVESAQRQYGVWYHPSGLCPAHRKRKERWERWQ